MEQKDYEKALQRMWAARDGEQPGMVVGFLAAAVSGFLVGIFVGWGIWG